MAMSCAVQLLCVAGVFVLWVGMSAKRSVKGERSEAAMPHAQPPMACRPTTHVLQRRCMNKVRELEETQSIRRNARQKAVMRGRDNIMRITTQSTTTPITPAHTACLQAWGRRREGGDVQRHAPVFSMSGWQKPKKEAGEKGRRCL